jgi:hypothetical protein
LEETMTRSAARRPVQVQADKPPIPPPSPANSDGPVPPLAPAAGMSWQWRTVMFLWTTSFLFLLLYEWLTGLLKTL